MTRAGWLVLGALTAFAQIALAADGSFERRLQVKGSVLLSVDTGSGWVHVSSGNDTEVHVVAHVHTGEGWGMFGGGGSPEDRVKAVVANPPVQQTGNIISIGKGMNVRNVAIDYEVTVPRGTDLRVNTGSGDVRVSDDKGPVEVKTGSGSIETAGLGGRVWLETGSGDIHAGLGGSTEVKAETGSGSIELREAAGSLWAHTGSGDVRVNGTPKAAWKVETGSGGVELALNGAPCSLDAETGSGSVEAPDAHSVGGDKHHVVADVRGGGPKVHVVTGSGDVRVQ